MLIENRLIAYTLLALLVALVVSFLMTPIVKTFAYKVGAIDVPKDARRMHKVPIPRLGGLAIFIGFMVSILLFVPITPEIKSILLGAVIIVVLGVVDDIMALPALLKFVVQIVAALIPATHGVVIQAFSNPNVFSDNPYWVLGNLSVPLTVLWIVAITNAVNLIDGLDGLAAGTVMIVMIVMAAIAYRSDLLEPAIFAAALAGACIGFLWFNSFPADIFMGDTGSLALGMALGCLAVLTKTEFVSIIIGGLFVAEALSVMIQVFYYKKTRKRIFLMAPLHHHFEKKGWSETKVVVRFWIVSGVLAACGFSLYFAQTLMAVA